MIVIRDVRAFIVGETLDRPPEQAQLGLLCRQQEDAMIWCMTANKVTGKIHPMQSAGQGPPACEHEWPPSSVSDHVHLIS